MSEALPFPPRAALKHMGLGLALWAAFSGLAACGTDSANDGAVGSRTPEVSTDTAIGPVSGQSGTEYDGDGSSRPACPCGAGGLNGSLRGTVLEIVRHIEGTDGFPIRMGNVRLRVEELFGNTTGIELGSEISGRWFGDLPCFNGCASIEVGDEVFGFYRPEEPCIRTDGVECSNGDTIAATFSGLTLWDETLLLARFVNGDLTLAVEDIPLLDSPECRERIGSTGDLVSPNEVAPACYERARRGP